MAESLCILLYLSSLGKYFQIVGYWVLQACECFEAYTIRFPSASGLQWDTSWLWRTSAPCGICLFHPADHYSHADAARPIPFYSPRRADSTETFPNSGGDLPPEISAFFNLLTSIAMRTLWNLYHSIPLNQRILRHPVPTLSDSSLKCYPNLSTWVPWASTFKLSATGCYRHANT